MQTLKPKTTAMKIFLGLVALVAVGISPVGWVALIIFGLKDREAYLRRPDVYEPVGRILALYCQSDSKLLPITLNRAWLPDSLRKFPPSYGSVDREQAYLEFGGGFHHFGYSLNRDKTESRPGVNVWRLYLYSDTSSTVSLQKITLASNQSLSMDALQKQVVSGYDRWIADTPDPENRLGIYQKKITFLLRNQQSQEARKVCAELLRQMPDNWWARLVNALITHAKVSPEEGERQIRMWVTQTPNFFTYLDLAYFYERTNAPKKAAAAMVSATNYDANVDWGHGGNAEYRGYLAARYAFQSGEYKTVILLCDKLLTVTMNGGYAKSKLHALKEVAEKRLRAEPAPLPQADEPPFTALRAIDLEALLNHQQ